MPRKTPLTLAKATKIGCDIAKSFYQDFVDHPEYRGSAFTWTRWVDMCFRYARAQAGMSNYTHDKQEIIATAAWMKARELIKEQKP